MAAFETGSRRSETGTGKQASHGSTKRRLRIAPLRSSLPVRAGTLRHVPRHLSPIAGFQALARFRGSSGASPVHGFPLLVSGLVKSFRGGVGDRVFKTYGDKIIVTRMPCFDGYMPSAAQRDRRDKRRAATFYAQAVYANPAARAIYVAAAKQIGRQPFRLAVSDFLRGRPRVLVETARSEKHVVREACRHP